MERVDTLYSRCSRNAGVQDCLFLTLIVILSLIWYIRGLGFYLDDYAYLRSLFSAHDQSVLGLTRALYSGVPGTRFRPVEVFLMASQYWLFGAHPLPYHLLNSAVLLSSILLFYLVLREMGQPRLLTLTVPLVYALLPHYSTDRFWVVTSPHLWSITLYFLSLYADLRALRNRLAHIWRWKLLSMISLVGSGLAYEVALPLFILHPLIIWRHAQQLYGRVPGRNMVRQNAGVLLGSNLLLLGLVLAFKVVMTIHLGDQTGLRPGIRRGGGYLDYVVFLVTESIRVNLGTYGVGLPHVVWRAMHLLPDWTIIIVAGFFALIILAYLTYVARQSQLTQPSRATWRVCILTGLVVFGFGYAIFLSTDRIAFSSAGLDNRVAIAAAIGVAFLFVGGVGWLSSLFHSIYSAKRVFCILVSLLCACGFLVINTVAIFWTTAYRQQQVILADIRERIPALSPGSTLIVAGICPQIGPAAVFHAQDLAHALTLSYEQPVLRADVAYWSPRITEKGIAIRGGFYPYDEKLLLYNFTQKIIYPLPDAGSVRRYSQMLNSHHDCLPVNWGWRTETPSPRS